MAKWTPEQTRRVEKAYTDLNEYWQIVPKTQEIIRIKPIGFWNSVKDFFWKKKHTVWEFYWWIKQRWGQKDSIVYSYPIKSDNMPIRGYHMKYQLTNDWTIPKKDLKYLKKGPLVTQDLNTILVNSSRGWNNVVIRFLSQYGRIITAVAATITIIRWIYLDWNSIVNFFNDLFQ